MHMAQSWSNNHRACISLSSVNPFTCIFVSQLGKRMRFYFLLGFVILRLPQRITVRRKYIGNGVDNGEKYFVAENLLNPTS